MSSSNSQLSGRKLRAHIQKKPFTQKLNGIDYTYAILPKKQKTFVLTHQRFLVLKGIESIYYSRSFPDGTNLPFKSAIELPQPKVIYKISEIERFYTDQQKLLIHFSGQDRDSWQFVCPSKVCAHEWRKRIEEAISQFNDYKQSKYEKYQEYLEMKRREEEMQAMRRAKLKEHMIAQSLGNGINNSNLTNNNGGQFQPQPPQSMTDSRQNQLASSIVNVSVSPPPNSTVVTEPQKSEIKAPKQPPSDPHFTFSSPKKQEQNQQKPNPDDIDILDRLIKNNPSPTQPVFKKSPSSISVSGKETIREQLAGYRRDWLNEIVGSGQESELVMDFRFYVQKIVEVIISELYIPQQNKVFPYREWHRDFACFVLQDVYIQVYFYGQEQIEKKHQREAKTCREFKNYDYLLQTTKNQGILLTPFMVLFEYKGFTGMARTRIGNQNLPYENRLFYNQMDVQEFVQNSRINPEILLDQSKCKIVSYQPPRTRLNEKIDKVYFIERFNDFLPYEISQIQQEKYQLRPQLIQDRELEEYVFGDKEREAGTYEVQTLIDKKIDLVVKTIERGEEYFTNSKELANIVHSFGLNVRHYGLILKRVKQVWFKKILKTEMAARCLKSYFRFDLQNCVINQTERIDLKEKQSQRQKKRVISFLNVIFGNSEPTYHIWRGLNRYSKKYFQTQIWDEHFEDEINICFFLQALQSHLKIILSDQIHHKVYFKSSNSLTDSDFLRFECDVTYYNLDFTQKFEQIYSYLEDKSAESFSQLCRIMQKEVSKGKPYLFILKQHPIYDAICQYFLYFISIDDYPNVYNKIEEVNFPSRFVYENHLTQIKWYIKQNQLQNVSKPIKFIIGSGKKWLGELHPLFVKMNRVLAQSYLQNSDYYNQALTCATQSIKMQQIMNGGDMEWLWKDYYLLGRIHFNKGYYDKALSMVSRARELAVFEHVTDFQSYGEMMVTLCKCFLASNMLLDSYILARQLYNQLRDQRSQGVLSYLVQCVSLMKTLLERNQQHEAYYKFVETDFSHLLIAFVGNTRLLAQSIKLIIVPYLKNVILHTSNNRNRIRVVIQELRKINLTTYSCSSYLQAKIKEGKFPQRFLNLLKDIDKGLGDIQGHNMVERWVAFNKMSNQTLLERIGGAQIDRGFEFLADFTAILGLLGEEMDKQFVFMEK